MRLSDYQPDNWVVLKIINEQETLYKVLAGWSGGYLHGSSWRMNSGITQMKEDEEYYYFYSYSGSCYKCHKETQFLKMNNAHIYEQLKEKYGDMVELMPEDTDYSKVEWTQ